MKRTLNLIFVVITLLNCQKDKVAEIVPILPINVTSSQSVCFESRPLIRRVANLTGRISFSKENSLYTINYGVPGTYDSVWVGLVCNLPDAFRVFNKQVVFSGEYRKGPDNVSTYGGQEVYYLFLTEIK